MSGFGSIVIGSGLVSSNPYAGTANNYSSLPAASTKDQQVWLVINSEGTRWLPGSLGGTYYPSGYYWSNGGVWDYIGEFPYQALQADVDAGTIPDQFVSPLTLNNYSRWATKKNDSMSTNRLLGRGTAGTGAIEEITLGTNLSLTGTILNATGGGSTNLSYTASPTNGIVVSDTGTDATIPLGNGANAGLSLNDYTTAEKTKLSGIAAGAEVNVNADWNSVSGDSQILNKPIIPTQYTDELAQDAVGAMIDTTLTYVDGTPLLQRSALTGAITASAGSNATALGSFTTAQLNTALSDNDIATGGGTATGTNTGDQTSIVGISGTKAQFDIALSDGNFMYIGDAPTAHTHISTEITDFNAASRAQTEAELVAGANITITPSGSGATRQLTIASTGGGGGTITVQDEGTTQSTTVTTLNFVGSGVVASGSGSTATVTINGGGGGGSTIYSGSTTVDFGADLKGTNYIRTTIAGQTNIVPTSKIQVTISPVATADHNVYEHEIVPITFRGGNIVSGTSFDIIASTDWRLRGLFNVNWQYI